MFAAYLISLLWVLWFQRRRFFFSVFKPIADPKGMVGRIYKGNYYPLLYTKYKNPGLLVFREEDFYGFPIVSLWGLMTPGGQFGPRGMIGKIYVGYHSTV